MLDRELPLAGAAAPRTPLTLAVARPRRSVASGPRGALLARYFDERGYSVVAGRAALLARADGPADDAREAVLWGLRRSSSTGSYRPVLSASTTASTFP